MSKLKIEEILNNMTENIIYERLKQLALDRFVWEGLPRLIKPEYIEDSLYRHGQALFFNDNSLGLICLPCLGEGQPNVFGEHTRFRVTGYAGYSKVLTEKEGVHIKNNKLMLPTEKTIKYYAMKITNVERTIDTNITAQKTPKIIACDDRSILTFKNAVKQIEENALTVYLNKNIDISAIDVLDMTAPYVADKLTDIKHDLYNEVLTFLGINNANTDKRERLNADEVNSNNDFIGLSVDYMLETRQRACEEINAMFGLKLSVKLKEVKNSGEVHAGTEGDN